LTALALGRSSVQNFLKPQRLELFVIWVHRPIAAATAVVLGRLLTGVVIFPTEPITGTLCVSK
jgi:hypothetical protein